MKKKYKLLSSQNFLFSQKNKKKPHWAGYFLKNPGFFQPCLHGDDAAFLDDVAAQAAQFGLALLAVTCHRQNRKQTPDRIPDP